MNPAKIEKFSGDREKLNLRMKQKEERRSKTLNKVKYDSCKVLASDGRQLFNVDERKALWYVKKRFAVLVQEHPNIVV